MAEQINTRLLILETLVEVEKKDIFVKDALQKLLFQKQFLSKQDRAFISRMVEGVTEYQVRLDYVINQFSKTKVNKCKPLIRCVLRMGVYQILYMDSVPEEVACNESVVLTKKKGFHNLSGFVNGVLRNISRNKDKIVYPKKEDSLDLFYSVKYSMPEWIVSKLLSWYGDEKTEQILKATLEAPDLTIRVNTNQITKEDLIVKLQEKDIEVVNGNYLPEALHLKKINYVNRIPGFKEGDFFIQDESSMLLYHIANIDKELKDHPLKILDLCAAPGGKCTHFAQQLGKKAVIEARDVSQQKVSLIEENIERLHLENISVKVWDALVPDVAKVSDADIVIADLPCSGFGIMSKKNDIKYRMKELQLMELANLQKTILTNAASYVKPGGVLLYSTCTINPEENIANVEWLLKNYDFQKESIFSLVPEELRPFVIEENMLQLLPGVTACDGFFIAKLRKSE